MTTNKQIFVSQHFLAMDIANIFHQEKKNKLQAMRVNKNILPSPNISYEKDIVMQRELDNINNTRNENLQIKKDYFNSSLNFNNSTWSQLQLKLRSSSRFNFILSSYSQCDAVEIPEFVTSLISKKLCLSKDDKDLNLLYENKTLLREYNEHHPWARYIVSNLADMQIRVGIEKLAENEEKIFLNKFKSA